MFDLVQLPPTAPLAIHGLVIGALVIFFHLLSEHLKPQDFFRYWSRAWTAAGLQLALGWTLLTLMPSSPRVLLVLGLVAMVAGYAAVLLLGFGTLSLVRSGFPTRRARRAGYALALLAAVLSVGVSGGWGFVSTVGVAIRRVPLQAAAGATFL